MSYALPMQYASQHASPLRLTAEPHLGQRGWVRVQVDGVGVAGQPEVPSVLYVRHLEGVTDGLHVGRGLARLGPKDCRHARLEQGANCGQGRPKLVFWKIDTRPQVIANI